MSDAPMNAEPRLSLWCHANPDKAAEEIERLRAAIETVLNTFEKDEAQGFHSRDRQYAITILRKALAVTPADDVGRRTGCPLCRHDLSDHDRQYGCNHDGCDCEGPALTPADGGKP